jgi:VWFA-related protein
MIRLCAAGLVLLTSLAILGEPAQFRIKVGVDLVNVSFSVHDRKGRMVPTLSREDFAVEENGRRQEISRFSRESELPLTLAILLDTSPSVRPVFEEEIETAAGFVESIIRPRDLALVIAFDRHVTLAQDFTQSTRQLMSAITELRLGGSGTSLYDAVYLAAAEKLSKEVGRKAVILISDGEDTTSEVDLSRSLIATHRSDAVIYSIFNAPSTGRSGSLKTLRKLSEETGGKVYEVDEAGQFQDVFDQIALELRSQYTLAYHSNNPERDGKFRRIKILPKDSSLTVRARTGYYAARETDP